MPLVPRKDLQTGTKNLQMALQVSIRTFYHIQCDILYHLRMTEKFYVTQAAAPDGLVTQFNVLFLLFFGREMTVFPFSKHNNLSYLFQQFHTFPLSGENGITTGLVSI